MKDRLRAGLASALLILFATALAALFWRAVPESNQRLIDFMLGQLSVFVAGALTFYFGSSKGSADKSAVLASLARDGSPDAGGPGTPDRSPQE